MKSASDLTKGGKGKEESSREKERVSGQPVRERDSQTGKRT